MGVAVGSRGCPQVALGGQGSETTRRRHGQAARPHASPADRMYTPLELSCQSVPRFEQLSKFEGVISALP